MFYLCPERTYISPVLGFHHVKTTVLLVADKVNKTKMRTQSQIEKSSLKLNAQTYLLRLWIAIAPAGESGHANGNK